MNRRLRPSHVFESVLLLGAMVGLIFAMGATFRVGLRGNGHTEDLTFDGTTGELSRVLQLNGVERLGKLVRARFIVGTDTVFADTLVLAADSIAEPAAAKGGFLFDQVTMFNDHAVRQALLSAGVDPSRQRRLPEGPSLLRTAWTEDGAARLSDRPSPFVMTVRSPYAERTWREVRTTDWRRSAGLLGFDGDVPVGPDMPDPSRVHVNGNDCTIRRNAPRILLYCASALASDAGRFYDLGFEMRPGANGGVFTSAFAYRERNIWRNGRSETFGNRAVSAGDLFDVRGMGPFVLSVSDRGTLAAGQWINGRPTFANQRVGTISFFARAGRSIPSNSSAPLVLGLDAGLSADLDRAARRFMGEHADLSRMALVVLDLRTGEVKAIAEPMRESEDESLLSFEPLLVGSVVKPILASAILSRRPALAALQLMYAGDTVREVGGIRLARGFANAAADGCTGVIDFDAFLRCSSNQFAAELTVRSLQADGYRLSGGSAVVGREVLERSAIATGLAEAFDVDALARRTAGRNPHFWSPDCAPNEGEGAATGNRSLLPWESRPWVLFPSDSNGTRLDFLARYAFGGWENRWTLLGIAQSFARIATGREVHATFLRCPPSAANASRFSPAAPRVANAFARVRVGLRQVGVSGTAAGLTDRLQAATHSQVSVLVKTGTLNEVTGRFKALALAMGRVPATGNSTALECGLVAVSYFEFARERGTRAGFSPVPLRSVQVEFARGPFADVVRRHWDRVTECVPVTRANTSAPLERGGRRMAGGPQ